MQLYATVYIYVYIYYIYICIYNSPKHEAGCNAVTPCPMAALPSMARRKWPWMEFKLQDISRPFLWGPGAGRRCHGADVTVDPKHPYFLETAPGFFLFSFSETSWTTVYIYIYISIKDQDECDVNLWNLWMAMFNESIWVYICIYMYVYMYILYWYIYMLYNILIYIYVI